MQRQPREACGAASTTSCSAGTPVCCILAGEQQHVLPADLDQWETYKMLLNSSSRREAHVRPHPLFCPDSRGSAAGLFDSCL